MYVCMYVCMYVTAISKEKEKAVAKWSGATRTVVRQSSVPGTSAGGMLLWQVLQNETRYHQDLLSHLAELGNISDR
jgi:hypothetical protein